MTMYYIEDLPRVVISYEMTTSVRFVLSYDFLNTILSPLKWTFNIVVTDVVNDVTYSRKSVHTRVVIALLLHDVIHWKTATSYDKYFFLSCKKRKFSAEIFLYFSYFCSKHRLWVHVITASPRRF